MRKMRRGTRFHVVIDTSFFIKFFLFVSKSFKQIVVSGIFESNWEREMEIDHSIR